MLLTTTKKRRLTALLALPACMLIGLQERVLPPPQPASPPNAAVARVAGTPQTLAEALAAAKREGYALTAQDLQAPLPPPEQNAAPLYTELARQPGSPEPQWDILNVPDGSRLTLDQAAALRKSLADNFDNLERIHQAVARPHCVFLRDWAQPSGVTFPEYAPMRAAARWLTAESLLLLHDGKPLAAARTQALGFVIARHLAQEPTPIAYFVACAIQNITLRGMQNILLTAGADVSVANAVRLAVEQNRAGFSLARGLHGELAISLIRLESMRQLYPKEIERWRSSPGAPRKPDGSLPAPLSPSELASCIDRGKLLVIQQMHNLAELNERPYFQVRAAVEAPMAAADAAPPFSPMSFQAFSPAPFLQGPAIRARLAAQEETVRAASALLVYKAAHGAFPDKLETALTPAPADPFGTGALGYRRQGAGFVLYSVGKTGKYNGDGEPASFDTETCLRYPLLAAASK